MLGVIYKITNTVNNKIYIGQTIQTVEKRWRKHVGEAKQSKYPLQRAILQYGKESFTVEIIYECSTQEELDNKELMFAEMFEAFSPTGYNLKAGQGRGSTGEEARKHIGDGIRGKRLGDKNPMFGKKHSHEARRKMSESLLKLEKKNKRTHCPSGHEYTEENSLYHKNGETIARRCRVCEHERSVKKWKNRKKEE